MVYIILCDEGRQGVMLVKADDRKAVESKLVITEQHKFVGKINDNELEVLNHSSFTVVSG